MKKNVLLFSPLLFLLPWCWILFFSNLNWGTPSWEKHLQIFRDRLQFQQYVPKIIELRNKHYAAISNMLDPAKPFKETYDQIFHSHEQRPPFSILSQEWILDRIRGYLVGVVDSDEQKTMLTLSKIDPKKLQFDPGVQIVDYGGVYYYTCGASLLIGKLLGRVSLISDIRFYFDHPEQTSKMYALVRLISAVSVILTAGFLFYSIYRLFDIKKAYLTLLFFISMPALIPYSCSARAHLYGTFWLFLGFCLLWNINSDPALKRYILGSAVLGLSAGTIITNLTAGIVIFLIELCRNNWSFQKTFKNRNFWIACFIFLGVYALTNFYIFLHLQELERTLLAIKEFTSGYDQYGTINVTGWLSFFKQTFIDQFNWYILPLLVAGCYAAFSTRNQFLMVCVWTFFLLTAVNLLTTRHPGVNVRIFPFTAILCAAGAFFLLERSRSFWKIIFSFVIFCVLLISGLQSYFYMTLFSKPSHLSLASEWINHNIPVSASIGIIESQLIQTRIPAFHFLDYQLVHFPRPFQSLTFVSDQLPDYVITNDTNHPILMSHYALIQNWIRPKRFMGIPYDSRMVGGENFDIIIFKKT